MKLTLAITNYNRTDFMFGSFKRVLDNPYIDEILIVDDFSSPVVRNYTNNIVHRMQNHKIKLHFNSENIGMMSNKAKAVSLAKNEWVILFDSDNVIDDTYIDALHDYYVYNNGFKDNCIYMPAKANPRFDFTSHQGVVIDTDYLKSNIDDGNLNICMNTCNYLVNRDFYGKSFSFDDSIKGTDTVWHSINHIKNGGVFYVVPGMEYFHRVHDGSEFVKYMKYNMAKAEELRKMIKAL